MINYNDFGCSFTDFWVSPKNWQTATKKDLKKVWYVQCDFYDPRFAQKYPKGFPFRKKVNKPNTIEERKKMISFLLNELPKQLKNGYNPILKKVETPIFEGLNPHLPFINAFYLATQLKQASQRHKYNIKNIVDRLKIASETLHFQHIKVKDLKRSQLKQMLEWLQLPDKSYNKAIRYISSIYRELLEYECVESNITRDLYPKKVIKTQRQILSKQELEKVKEYLQENHPNFYRYMMIFLYSGARSTELFRLQKKDINLSEREFTIRLDKGGKYLPTTKVILKPAFEFWKDIISECKSDTDFLFGTGFKPNPTPIYSVATSIFWRRHIKKKLNITADFYAFKHYMLDNLDTETAMLLASHTNKNTTLIYQVNKQKKDREILKNLDINL